MITVSIWSFAVADFMLIFWFIYFQYYWFPELRQKHFLTYCAGMAVGFTFLDIVNPFTARSSLLGALAVVVMLVIEVALLSKDQQWQYLPAFIDVTIMAYLLTEFVDMVVLNGIIWLTSLSFATSWWGTLTEMTIDAVLFTLLAMGLWLTRAPMENLIQATLGRSMEYLFLIFMTGIALVYILFEYSLQELADSDHYLIFLTGVAGTLLIGLSLSTYMLMLTHLQEEHTQLQRQQQEFREQYTHELNRQMAAIRKFSHDYQNMLLGLGGYLEDQDYEGFRQLYIDIRSGWETSDAAELTIDDLTNIPGDGLRFDVYHNYLVAQEAGVQLFIKVPEPLTATITTLKLVGTLLNRTLPPLFEGVKHLTPAVVTLDLEETAQMIRFKVTFPVPDDAQVGGQAHVQSAQADLDLSRLQRVLPTNATSTLKLKRHWGQLTVALPKG